MQWLTTPAMAVLPSLRSGSALGPGKDPMSRCGRARRWFGARPAAQNQREGDVHPEDTGDEPAGAALVVFADDAGCPWLRPLRRGFRHCFVVLRAGSVWLACEPLKDRIELDAFALPSEFDFAAFYCAQGHRVLVGQRRSPSKRRRLALAPLTCVTVVKRLLGIDAPWVWTPWQLYAHLSGPKHGFKPCSGPSRAQNCAGGNPRENSALDMQP